MQSKQEQEKELQEGNGNQQSTEFSDDTKPPLKQPKPPSGS